MSSGVKISALPSTASLFSSDVAPFVHSGGTVKGGMYQLPFSPAGIGAVDRTLQGKAQEILTPEDFGAQGAPADDTTPLSDFVTELQNSRKHVAGMMLNKSYNISSALPQITAPVKLYGYMPPLTGVSAGGGIGTMINWIGAAGAGPMLTIAPVSSSSNRVLRGLVFSGIGLDCNGLLDTGIVIRSVCHSNIDIFTRDSLVAGCEMGVVALLNEVRSMQYNEIRIWGRQLAQPGVALLLKGDATANVSLNRFNLVDIQHRDAVAIVEENADGNTWGTVRTFKQPGGSATNSWECRGGASAQECCRDELITLLSTNAPLIAFGTGSFAVGSTNIRIINQDTGNGTPNPVVQPGASVFYYNVTAYP